MPSVVALLRRQLIAVKVIAEHSCMLFQSALLYIDLEQKMNSQATMQWYLASNPRAASQWWHSRLLQTKEYRCHASSPVYVPLSLLHLKLLRQLQQHFGNINKQAEVQHIMLNHISFSLQATCTLHQPTGS